MTTDSKEASYKTLNEAPLTRNTRLYFQIQYVFHRAVLEFSLLCYKLQVETAMLSVWCSVLNAHGHYAWHTSLPNITYKCRTAL